MAEDAGELRCRQPDIWPMGSVVSVGFGENGLMVSPLCWSWSLARSLL